MKVNITVDVPMDLMARYMGDIVHKTSIEIITKAVQEEVQAGIEQESFWEEAQYGDMGLNFTDSEEV